jgi:hypothetical protein
MMKRKRVRKIKQHPTTSAEGERLKGNLSIHIESVAFI